MATRTKVDAIAELGEKVTGETISKEENETIVGIIDKIAEKYEGGGSGGGNSDIILKTAIDLTQTQIQITDTEDVALLNSWVARIGEDSTDIPNRVIFSTTQEGTLQAYLFNIGMCMVNGSRGYFTGGTVFLSIIDGTPETFTKGILLTNEGSQNSWAVLLA